uniref:Uncharacterized protein n=1 Tax=Salix viminalis TaxID=40686 RepID=A0A6N2LJJ2_SALVM
MKLKKLNVFSRYKNTEKKQKRQLE